MSADYDITHKGPAYTAFLLTSNRPNSKHISAIWSLTLTLGLGPSYLCTALQRTKSPSTLCSCDVFHLVVPHVQAELNPWNPLKHH